MIDVRRFVSLGFVAALVLVATPGQAQQAPYEINAMLSLTGVAAFLGSSEKVALEVLEGVINKTGGIQGRPIKFVILDDASSPQQAVIVANSIIAKGVPVIIGPSFTATCKATESLFPNGPVDYCLSPAGGGPPGSYVFTSNFATSDHYQTFARHFRLRGMKRVAVLVSTDATGQDAERGITTAMALPENKDMTMVALERMTPGDLTAAAQLARIEAAKPDVLFAWMVGTPLGTVMRSINQTSFDKPVYTSAGNMTFTVMDSLSSLMPKGGLYMTAARLFQRDSLRPGPILDRVKAYDAAFKSAGLEADGAHPYAWDPAMIVVDALRKLGTKATATQLRDYLETVHSYYGVNGLYDFRDGSQRGLTGKSVVMTRWDPAKHTWVAVSEAGGIPFKVR